MNEEQTSSILTGIVKFYKPKEGFGFIRHDSHDGDIFVHITSVKDTQDRGVLREGEKVSFIVENSSRGPRAVNVVRT